MAKDNTNIVVDSAEPVEENYSSFGAGGGGYQTWTFKDSNGNIVTDETAIAEYIINHPEKGIDFDNPFVQIKINDGSFWGNKVNEGRVKAIIDDITAPTVKYAFDNNGHIKKTYVFDEKTDTSNEVTQNNENGSESENNPIENPTEDGTKAETPKGETPKTETPKDETPKGESDGVTDSSISEGNGDSRNSDSSAYWSAHKDEIATQEENRKNVPSWVVNGSGFVSDSESVRIYKVKTFINGFTPPGEYGDNEELLIKMLYAKFISPSCSTLFNNFQNTMKETIEGVIVPTLDDVMNTLNATNSNQYMSTGDGDAVTNGERLKTAKTNIEAFKTHMLSLTQEEFANTLNTYNEKFKEGKKKTRVYLLKKQANEVINPDELPTGEENFEGIVWLKQSSPPAEYKGEQINDFKRKKYWFEGPVDSFKNPDTGDVTYAYRKINRPIYYIAPEVIESALDSGENHERLESAELNCPQKTKYDPGSVVMEVGM